MDAAILHQIVGYLKNKIGSFNIKCHKQSKHADDFHSLIFFFPITNSVCTYVCIFYVVSNRNREIEVLLANRPAPAMRLRCRCCHSTYILGVKGVKYSPPSVGTHVNARASADAALCGAASVAKT